MKLTTARLKKLIREEIEKLNVQTSGIVSDVAYIIK